MRIRDLQPGLVIDAWRIDAPLGGGGMGAVFACTNVHTGQRAALKLLHEHVAIDPRLRARFVTEGRALSRVPHPGVVRALGEGEFAGVPYLVMELAIGRSLKAHAEARGGSLLLSELDPIVTRLLDVLGAVHDAGIIHRDIKPDNVVLCDDQRVKLVDFGIARIEEDSSNTTTGTTLGTPAFMAPEQVLGREGRVDKRADIYSVGAVAHRLLSGQNLHHPATGPELLIAMGTRQAPSILTVVPRLPLAVARVIDRSLSFDREARFSSAREMAVAWRAAVDAPAELIAAGVSDMQTLNTANLAEPPPRPVTKTLPMAPAKRPAGAGRKVWLVAGAIGGLLVASVGGAAAHRAFTTGGFVAPKEIPVKEQNLKKISRRLEEHTKGLGLMGVTLTPHGATAAGQTRDHRGKSVICIHGQEECQIQKLGDQTPYPETFRIEDVAWDKLPLAIREAESANEKESGAAGVVETAMFGLFLGAPRWSITVRTKNEIAVFCLDTETNEVGCGPRASPVVTGTVAPDAPLNPPTPVPAVPEPPAPRSAKPKARPCDPFTRTGCGGLDSRF